MGQAICYDTQYMGETGSETPPQPTEINLDPEAIERDVTLLIDNPKAFYARYADEYFAVPTGGLSKQKLSDGTEIFISIPDLSHPAVKHWGLVHEKLFERLKKSMPTTKGFNVLLSEAKALRDHLATKNRTYVAQSKEDWSTQMRQQLAHWAAPYFIQATDFVQSPIRQRKLVIRAGPMKVATTE